MVCAIGGEFACTDMVGTIGSDFGGAGVIKTIGSEFACTDVIGTIGGDFGRAGVVVTVRSDSGFAGESGRARAVVAVGSVRCV